MEEKKSSRGRSLFVSFGLVFLFSSLLIHYYKIQVIDHQKWVKIAESQHHLVIKEPFQRGKIYCRCQNDSKGRPLAMDVLAYHLFIDPLQIKAPCK